MLWSRRTQSIHDSDRIIHEMNENTSAIFDINIVVVVVGLSRSFAHFQCIYNNLFFIFFLQKHFKILLLLLSHSVHILLLCEVHRLCTFTFSSSFTRDAVHLIEKTENKIFVIISKLYLNKLVLNLNSYVSVSLQFKYI